MSEQDFISVKGVSNVFVAATSRCFSNLSIGDALDRLVDLEYTAVEIMVHEKDGHLRPSAVLNSPGEAAQIFRNTRRLMVASLSVDLDAPTPGDYYAQFQACCRLAKANKIVTLTIRSSELGTPFNEEVERLRKLVQIASVEGVVVGLLTEVGRISQDPMTVKVLCDNVKGLGVTLDPSHFVCGPHKGGSYDHILEYVVHVRLRDTTAQSLQVQVGQGEIEYGRLVSQLAKHGYNRALTVDILPLPDVDQSSELRKIRLLLESLL